MGGGRAGAVTTPTQGDRPTNDVSWPRIVGRGLARHCPKCGAGHLFSGWFRMAGNCPRCGLRFEREEGFFLGVYFVNICITQLAVVAYLGVVFALTIPDPNLVLTLVGALVLAVAVPIAAYPVSRTIWAGVHLAMAPLEPQEEADRAVWLFERDAPL